MEQAPQIIRNEAFHLYWMAAVCEHFLHSGNLSGNCGVLWFSKAYKDTFIPFESCGNASVLVGSAQEKGR